MAEVAATVRPAAADGSAARSEMRILALHPSGSSADGLQASLRDLDDGLRSRHGIELVYVDGPLSTRRVSISQTPPANATAPTGGANSASGGVDDENVSGGNAPGARKRCWFDAVQSRRQVTGNSEDIPKDDNAAAEAPITFVGLDASILHLSQIWNKRVHSAPFSGILAFGQSAAIAALLPLLMRSCPVLEDGGNDNEQLKQDNDTDNGNDGEGGSVIGVPLFPGLDFVVLVDGFDITEGTSSSQQKDSTDNHDGGDAIQPWFDDGAFAPQSLHILSKPRDDNTPEWTRGSMSSRLAKRYGPRAEIHERSVSSTSSSMSVSHCGWYNDVGIVQPLRKREFNVIGRFIVDQKNSANAVAARSDGSTELLAQRLQTEITIQKTRERLAVLEEQAERALVEHVGANPPRALMAIIAPDAVGAWNGPKWRSPDMDGGGAPCPGEFKKREDERDSRVDEEGGTGDDSNSRKARIIFEREEGVSREKFEDSGISRAHPSAS
mmetsp:Transcript_33125/g.72649  ORF Transcript_33125/g.72649 Transcript_33125/m.72649 type:complete len:496 (-) Transcript_33125:62-1549(-)